MGRTTTLSDESSGGLPPAEVRDRVRAAVAANAAELAARRRWATIYRNGRPPASPADARLRVARLREALTASSTAA